MSKDEMEAPGMLIYPGAKQDRPVGLWMEFRLLVKGVDQRMFKVLKFCEPI